MENMTPATPLGLPENATTVRVENGSNVTTEGPYLGAKGAVGGFYVVEVADRAAAVAIAARVPQARLGGAVEVRPSAKYWCSGAPSPRPYGRRVEPSCRHLLGPP